MPPLMYGPVQLESNVHSLNFGDESPGGPASLLIRIASVLAQHSMRVLCYAFACYDDDGAAGPYKSGNLVKVCCSCLHPNAHVGLPGKEGNLA